jgi:hypothetical protein
MDRLITIEQLKTLTGYTRVGDVERCLHQNGVAFLYGRHGPFTTVDALNVAMGIQLNNELISPSGPIEFM